MFTNGIFLIFSVWREWKNKVVFTLGLYRLHSVSICSAGFSNERICSRCARRTVEWRSLWEISLQRCSRVLPAQRVWTHSLADEVSLKAILNLTCCLWKVKFCVAVCVHDLEHVTLHECWVCPLNNKTSRIVICNFILLCQNGYICFTLTF